MDVPLGTVAYEADTRRRIGEVLCHAEELIIARGGMGGKGNTFFKSPTNQTPREAQPGEAGEDIAVEIELKLIADVGLVGLPNAGKSTLLSVVSAAKPKIADYPFTTLEPNLGVVTVGDHRSFVMADIPGIIEDAHKGKGLGTRFLRHIERNATLLFMVPCDTDSIRKEYEVLIRELEMYNPELLHKPRVLAVTKSDLIDRELKELLKPEIPRYIPVVFISAVAQQGLTELKDLLWETINAQEEEEEEAPSPGYDPNQ